MAETGKKSHERIPPRLPRYYIGGYARLFTGWFAWGEASDNIGLRMEVLEHTPNPEEECALARRRKMQTFLILLGTSVLQFPIWGQHTTRQGRMAQS
jgi:hypothetical protein